MASFAGKFLRYLGICLALMSTMGVASAQVAVNESKARFIAGRNGASDKLILPFSNSLKYPLNAEVQVDILDPKDDVRAWAHLEAELLPESHTLKIPFGSLPLVGSDAGEDDEEASGGLPEERLWYRVRYRLKVTGPSANQEVGGIMALGMIMPELFVIRVANPSRIMAGGSYAVRVRAAHPLTNKPAAGVSLSGTLGIENQKALERKATTDSRGNAVIVFTVPASVVAEDAELNVVATRGAMKQELFADVEFAPGEITITSDKPIYQPGQELHLRALLVSPAKRVASQQQVDVKIVDPESTTVFRKTVASSRFGIVRADWRIPQNQRLGDYRIEVNSGDGSTAWTASETVKISRYELPNFALSIKPDRGYYLKGQNARVEVRADYLFGKPVKSGQVRVVREASHRWNYAEQKYESEEAEEYKGKLEPDGRFVAEIDLAGEHEDLADDTWYQFRDLTFAAYVTDETSGRTEQRRFDLRITRDPIHVYLISNAPLSQSQPLNFYLSAQYADGAPCRCAIELSRSVRVISDKGQSARQVWLRTVHANRYGLAKVEGLTMVAEAQDEAGLTLRIEAHDRGGKFAKREEPLYGRDQTTVRITTDKALYRAGEPIAVTVESSKKSAELVVQAETRTQVIDSRVVRLQQGRAAFTIPYSAEMREDVAIFAYDLARAEARVHWYFWETAFGSRTVLYPQKHGLNLSVQFDHASYKPGQEAQARLRVRRIGGSGTESALGISIVDSAVEARARTELEFGRSGGWDRSRGFWFRYDTIAGVTREDLNNVDLTEPIPPDFDLLAEVLLSTGGHNFGMEVQNSASDEAAEYVFRSEMAKALDPLFAAFKQAAERTGEYPHDDKALDALLAKEGIVRSSLHDPWGLNYRAEFSAASEREDKLAFISAGPDKTFGTADDFEAKSTSWPYFHKPGDLIDTATYEYHGQTGGYLRDAATLKAELKKRGLDLDSLRDRWGQPYRLKFDVRRRDYTIEVVSNGPNKVQDNSESYWDDDFIVWTTQIDYLSELEQKVNLAVNDYYRSSVIFPQDETELGKALAGAGLSLGGRELRDHWGNPYYPVFTSDAAFSDRIRIVAGKAKDANQRLQSTPVTRWLKHIQLRSSGADGVRGTYDDFDLAHYTAIFSEQSARDVSPQATDSKVIFTGSNGAVAGTVTDQTSAVIPGAQVTISSGHGLSATATTDLQGQFLFLDLPPDEYSLRVESPGFNPRVITHALVTQGNITKLEITLSVGTAETVTVEATSNNIVTVNSSVSAEAVSGLPIIKGIDGLALFAPGIAGPRSTPRVREYFPETLLWEPELITDKRGNTRMKFKVADNITSWKLTAWASTEDGELGKAEQQFTVFKPFFVDHDPPPVLTQNDEIFLPVLVRNYLATSQTVDLDLTPESWFAITGDSQKHTQVAAGETAREIFPFRVTAAVAQGKQRITAIGRDGDDAIERKVSVHPDGEEQESTQSVIFSQQAFLHAALPAYLVPGSNTTELKIYPNLTAHVLESVEAVMRRPYGCAEQTISSTYPSLLALRAYRQLQMTDTPGARRAQRYLEAGYERLLSYRVSGGFGYWTRGDANAALTAYALRFLNDARSFIAVDEDVITEARRWLFEHQQDDGSWVTPAWNDDDADAPFRISTTAYITRVLAATNPPPGAAQKDSEKLAPNYSSHLKLAMQYLASRIGNLDEPYAISNYALAAWSSGDKLTAEQSASRLRAIAHQLDNQAYWDLQQNTPFYSWGLPGRVETTAVSLLALSQITKNPEDTLLQDAVRFLMQSKDRFGIWYSGQATINVLEGLLAAVGKDESADTATATLTIKANGKVVRTVELPPAKQLAEPITVNLSDVVVAGANTIELMRGPGAPRASAQLVSTFYVPWVHSEAGVASQQVAGDSDRLELGVRFDKTKAAVGEEIRCTVEAQRIGFRGYGMMLAEIGLPPGADVNRASLEKAVTDSGWTLNHYDVLPDRVVAYVWPSYKGRKTQFTFSFRARFGMHAQTAPSVLYDYYNPEARAVVKPVTFQVQ